jgi:hypothetical protein
MAENKVDDLDRVSELSSFNYNKRWFLFSCKCGFGSNKSRKALKHLESQHQLNLMDGDIHIKLRGKFFCDCGNVFASDMVSIVYQSKMVRKLTMDCEKCGSSIYPVIHCSGRTVSYDILTVVCRWKLTMRMIKGSGNPFYKPLIDHKENLCQACKMGVCSSKGMIDYDPEKLIQTKVFLQKKHQVVSINKQFEILSLAESVISGQTSIL